MNEEEIVYVYELVCRFSGLKLVGMINRRNVKNTIFFTNRLNDLSYRHCFVMSFDFQQTVRSNPNDDDVQLPTQKPFHLRKLRDVCDDALGMVLKMSDDSCIVALANPTKIYEKKMNLSTIAASIKPRSIIRSDYGPFGYLFKRIINDWLINDQTDMALLM